MNKIIYLDIDGVLNCSALNYSKELYDLINDYKVENSCDRLSKSRIQNLNTLIEDTGAKVVISSTWRKYYTIEELRNIFNDAGFIGEIIDYTPVITGLRGVEIHEHVKKNYGTYDNLSYLIIDDDADMLYWHRNNFLLVDRECGLSVDMAYKGTRILNKII